MQILSKPRRQTAFVLLLGLLAGSGVWLLKISTPFGLGLIDDAISYVAAARALLAGQGFTRIWLASGLEPITHWPPLFPATIAVVSRILDIDPYRGARVVNILVFGANTALLGWLGWKMTRSYWAGIFLSLLFLSNNTLLRLHAYALSEPLYLFISLLAFLTFARYFENAPDEQIGRVREGKWLILAGILTGLSYLARYAALSLFATFIVVIFILRPTWRKRFSSLALFLAGALPVMMAWMLRNKLVGGSATNRAMEWHPVTTENVYRGIYTVMHFLIPNETWWLNSRRVVYRFESILFWIAFAILIWVLWAGLRCFFKPKKYSIPEVLSFSTGIYIFGYMGSLLFSLNFFDAATPLNDRILSPIYVALMILLVALGVWIWRTKYFRSIIILTAFFVLGISSFAQFDAYNELKETPSGFASWRWSESTVMQAIRELPDDMPIYTNQQPAVYFWTNRPPWTLPRNEDKSLLLRDEILAGKAVLAIFPQGWSDNTERQIQILTSGLEIIEKSNLGTLYGVPR